MSPDTPTSSPSGLSVIASPLGGREIAYKLTAGAQYLFFSSSPLRGEDSAARFSYFTKTDLAALGGGGFCRRDLTIGEHPHLTTASLREAVVVLPPTGGGGENRYFKPADNSSEAAR
jgi:hypothetical protein